MSGEVIKPILKIRRPMTLKNVMRPVRIGSALVDIARRNLVGRGQYRVFNAAEYRLYRKLDEAPTVADTPFAVSATLPVTPVIEWADGVWFVGVTYFNGIEESGFLTVTRLEIAGGAVVPNPPEGPMSVALEVRGGGVIRVVGIYGQAGPLRATQWAIAYTIDGSDPVADSPTITPVIGVRGVVILSYDLPAQVHDTQVRVRVQTRRQIGESWRYSEGSSVISAVAVAQGPGGGV